MTEFAAATPEEIVDAAVAAARLGDVSLRALLDNLPAPVYTTDAEGRISYFNQACVTFAGRMPETGRDRWCVTWKLYESDGSPLPHERCPMAVAIESQRPVRGEGAVAERPDGSRIAFIAYPTPLFDEAGEMIGAVNLLVDASNARQADFLHDQAVRCRRLAASLGDQGTVITLKRMADQYEEQAQALRRLH